MARASPDDLHTSAVAALRRTPIFVPVLGVLAALAVAAGVFVVLRGGGEEIGQPHATYRDSLTKPAATRTPKAPKPSSSEQAKIDAEARALGLGSGHPRAVEPQAGVVADDSTSASGPTPEELAARGAERGPSGPSAKELQQELKQLKRSVGISGHPRVTSAGLAAVPSGVPAAVRAIVNSANKIALLPYRYGGGHASFRDSAYDCSASVSYALAAAGLVNEPLDSTAFMRWGAPGRGKYVTVYANEGHAFMFVDGLRFDTGNLGGGTRWTAQSRDVGGFVARHPPGL
jgi:cell wall-associated NlpC family hydrolase